MKDCRECPYVQAQRESGILDERRFHVALRVLIDKMHDQDGTALDFWEAIGQDGFHGALERFGYNEYYNPAHELPLSSPAFQEIYQQLDMLMAHNGAARERAVSLAQASCTGPEADEFMRSMGAEILHCTATHAAEVWHL